MKNLVFVISILLANILFGQENCDCDVALSNLISKIESEYPGFTEKTKDTLLYNILKQNLIKDASVTKNENCLPILQKYVAFFKDRHIWLLPNEQHQNVNKLENPKSEIFKIDIKKFKKEIRKSKDSLEGIWKNDAYEIGVKKVKTNEYVGFIINADPKFWKPNEIKFKLNSKTYTFEYKMQDHSVSKGNYKLLENGLLYFKEILTELVKQSPNKNISSEEIENRVNELNGFYCKRLTPKTTILKLSNFSYPFVDVIEKLIDKNKDILQNSHNLIIDLRGNGGGTTNAFQKILPYILSNPVRSVGAEYLSTSSFINGMKSYKETLVNNEKNKKEIEEIDERIRLLEQNPNKYVNFSGKDTDIETFELEPKSPKQIVFLTDRKIASAAESFLLIAKQSKKVKLLGTPTSGVLDYANVFKFSDFLCNNYQLYMPTYRSLRLPDYPIDNIGIQPDIYMDKFIEDWIQYAVDYLEN